MNDTILKDRIEVQHNLTNLIIKIKFSLHSSILL